MSRTQRFEDLTGIRQPAAAYQVRLSAGYDPITGKQVFVTGAAPDKGEAIKLRDRYRQEITGSAHHGAPMATVGTQTTSSDV